MSMNKETLKVTSQVNAALQMLKILRDPDQGCPWLSSKSFDDLFPYYLEELHEYKEAVQEQGNGSPEAKQELADLLFQTLLHACLLSENDSKSPSDTLESLADAVVKKLERRHPHVFDPSHKKYKSAEEAGKAWEELKIKEAKQAGRKSEVSELMADKIARIPKAIPSLQRAARIGEKTHSFSFDWKSPSEVMEKVKEEVSELEEASESEHQKEELGDVLFSLAQLARHLGACPEELSHQANQKFITRFRLTENLALQKGLKWDVLSSQEKEALWVEAKNKLK